MPLGPGVRYRYKAGTHTRLAFKGNTVIEAKNMQSGATHSPADFAADRQRRQTTRATTRGGRR